MQKLSLFGWIVGLMAVCYPLTAQEVRFPVRHDHVIGSCAGELIFREDRIEYATHDAKHARVWKYGDIQQICTIEARNHPASGAERHGSNQHTAESALSD